MYDDIFAKIALAKIEEAIQKGEFDNLPGQGKPVNLDYMDQVPAEMRAAYSILKNSGLLPEDAQLLKEMAAVREELKALELELDLILDPKDAPKEEAGLSKKNALTEKKNSLSLKLRDLELKYKLLNERAMRKRS